MSQLTPDEAAHAASITEPAVVEPIPPLRVERILVGSIVRKPALVVEAFLKTLIAQVVERAELSFLFITDFAPSDAFADEALKVLSKFTQETPHATFTQNRNTATPDYGDGPTTRVWTPPAFARVGALKNALIQQALSENFDALWLVDADVLCDPYTLQSLRDCAQSIVAGVYWTRWQRPLPGDATVVHAGPQVWLRHPYELSGHGYSEPEFRKSLVERKLLRVWGLGACTLFQRSVLEKGVSFTPVPEGLPQGPMSEGEDRHLCERARRLHIPLYADAWPDIYHAYHPAEYGEIPHWLARCQDARPVQPQFGDLVSARVQNLEQPELAPQWVRGRLGALGVVPEFEEAIASLSVRDSRIVRVHFPIHFPFAPYRGKTLLFHVKLLDVKPYALAPVIACELVHDLRTGAAIDTTTLMPAQLDTLLEEAHAS